MNNELKWEISRAERRGQIQKAVIIIGPILLLLVISTVANTLIKNHGCSLKKIAAVVFFTILGFLVLLIINRFFPHKTRSYILNNNGLTVSKGKKTKKYLWGDFECFYPYYMNYSSLYKPDESSSFDIYRSDAAGERRKMFEADKNIEGSIFYLKKKPENIFSRLYKSFVVIYSEVDNSNAVSDFLGSRLSQKIMSAKTELGLILYEFK